MDISGLLIDWMNSCDKFAVYEHPTDDGCQRTHCHIVAVRTKIVSDSVKARFKAKGIILKGNSDWTFKDFDEAKNPFIYLSKGKHDPIIVKGYDLTWIHDQRGAYVAPVKKELRKEKVDSDCPVKDYLMESLRDKYQKDSMLDYDLVHIMKWAIGMYRRKKGSVPSPGHFKPVIVNLFYSLCEWQVSDGLRNSDEINDIYDKGMVYLGYFRDV